MYDTHIHTKASHDSEQTFDMICQAAIQKGLKAVSFTDHVDLLAYSDEKNINTILNTAEFAESAKKIYGDKLEVLTGVEIAMPSLDLNKTKEYLSLINADIVLGSVHGFMYNEEFVRLSYNDLSENAVSAEKLYKYVNEYYKNLLPVAQKADIDVLCHLTYPIRYTNKKYNRNIDINAFGEIIDGILKTIISRNIALEINTAKVENDLAYLCPDLNIVKNYYNLGGRLVTLGSDAHTPEKIGNVFDKLIKELKCIGFENYVYFKSRKPVYIKL